MALNDFHLLSSFLLYNSNKKSHFTHNIDILSVLVGNLLGNSYAELRHNSPRFFISLHSRNREYIHWLHNFYILRDYSNHNPLKLKKHIGKKNLIYFFGHFHTYSFSNLFWFYHLFYPHHSKQFPLDIKIYLTPLALAIWFMDNGATTNLNGAYIKNHNFTLHELEIFKIYLFDLYQFHINLIPLHHYTLIHIPPKDLIIFHHIIKPFMIKSMFSSSI